MKLTMTRPYFLLLCIAATMLLATVAVAQSSTCTYLYVPSNGPKVEAHAGDECNRAAQTCDARQSCSTLVNGCNMKNAQGIALQYVEQGLASCPDIPYNRFGPGSAAGERMVAEPVSVTPPTLPPPSADCLQSGGYTYCFVDASNAQKDTGDEACQSQGLVCNGYVWETPDLCQRFFPAAAVASTSDGDFSAVLCNGGSQQGVCATEYFTCHECPNCVNSVGCSQPIGSLYAGMFVQCDAPPVPQAQPFNPSVTMMLTPVPTSTRFPGETVIVRTQIDLLLTQALLQPGLVQEEFMVEFCEGQFDFVSSNLNVKSQQTVPTAQFLQCPGSAIQIVSDVSITAQQSTFVDTTLKVETDQSSAVAVGLRRLPSYFFGGFELVSITAPWKVGPINDPANAAALGVNPGDEIPIHEISDLIGVLAVTDLIEPSPGATVPFSFPANVRVGADLFSITQQPTGELLLSRNALQQRNTDILCGTASVNQALRQAQANQKIATVLAGCQFFPVTFSGLVGSIAPTLGGAVTGPTSSLGNPGSSSGGGSSRLGAVIPSTTTRPSGALGSVINGGSPAQIVQGAGQAIAAASDILTAGPRAVGTVLSNVANVINPKDLASLEAPSCADGVKNQGETGPDCGGPCSDACTELPASPWIARALWVGSFLFLALLLALLVVTLLVRQRTPVSKQSTVSDSKAQKPAASVRPTQPSNSTVTPPSNQPIAPPRL